MKTIHVIAPVVNSKALEPMVASYVKAASPEFAISGSTLEEGPESIESTLEMF